MSKYGMAIQRADGRWFASPEFTPYVLVSVIDQAIPVGQSSTGLNVQTSVPNGNKALLFHRMVDKKAGIYCQLINGANGFKVINIPAYMSDASAGTTGTFTIRFYIFSNYVAYSPRYGIAFYRNNVMVYCGNCLPLQLKFFTTPNNDPTPNVAKAVMFAFTGLTSNPIPGSSATLTVVSGWGTLPGGAALGAPYQSYSGSGGPSTAKPTLTCLYVETALYDTYYRQSLGL